MSSFKRFARYVLVGGALMLVQGTARAQYPEDHPAMFGYIIQTDPLTPVIQEANRAARRAGAPLFLDGVGFNLSRTDDSDMSYENRQVLSEGWALALANLAEQHGFEFTSDSRLRRLTGVSPDQFRDMMLRNQPYAIREDSERHFGREVYFLLNERPPGCPGDNGMAVMAFAYYPTEGVASEYGSVVLFVIGAGECASRGEAQRLLRRIKDDIIREFTRSR